MFPYQVPLTKGASLPGNGARKESCPQAEADIEKYVHMFRDRGVDKNEIRT